MINLSVGETIVRAEETYFITWNGSATFSVYNCGFVEFDCFTCYVDGVKEAIEVASEYGEDF